MENRGTPQGGTFGGPSQPGERKGLSKGCIIGLIAALVLAVGGGILLAAVGLGGYYFYQSGANNSSGASSSANGTTATAGRGTSAGSSAASGAEAPNPTEAQRAAVAGGQTAAWAQQEITWTVPQRWTEQEASSTQLIWRSPGSWDAANLIVTISPMPSGFPWETSNDANYQGAMDRKSLGQVDEVKWLALDGIKGVMFRESSPEDEESPQRLQWLGYRNYKGQVQYVNIMLATQGKYFARHEDALYGVLYSTDFGQ